MRVSKSFTITLDENELNKLNKFKSENEHISLGRVFKRYLMTEIEKETPFVLEDDQGKINTDFSLD